MIRSMTGYGRGESKNSGMDPVIEVRSVNHRYLEIMPKISKKDYDAGALIKQKIKEHYSRGYFEIFLNQKEENMGRNSLKIDNSLVTALLGCARNLKETYHIQGDIDLNTIMQMEGIICREEEPGDRDMYLKAIDSALETALSAMEKMKIKEGEAIRADLEQRLTNVERLLEGIETMCPELISRFQENFRRKIENALGEIQVDEGRITQEIALLTARGDIMEELVRLKSHFVQFSKTMDCEPPVGKKLDFILQEIFREVNTIGSKSGDSKVINLIVSIKSEVERMKEQVQNVE